MWSPVMSHPIGRELARQEGDLIRAKAQEEAAVMKRKVGHCLLTNPRFRAWAASMQLSLLHLTRLAVMKACLEKYRKKLSDSVQNKQMLKQKQPMKHFRPSSYWRWNRIASLKRQSEVESPIM